MNRDKTVRAAGVAGIILIIISVLSTCWLLLYDPVLLEHENETEKFFPEPEVNSSVLSLWCMKDDPFFSVMEKQTEIYNRVAGREYIRMSSFDSEDEMARTMDIDPPDMFITSYERAHVLAGAGKLYALSENYGSPAYKDVLREEDEDIGHTVFPLGVSTNVLICKKGSLQSPFTTFDDLFRSAGEYGKLNKQPFLYVSDFSTLFERAVRERGDVFDYNINGTGTGYKAIYNHICKAACLGGIICGEYDAAFLLENGYAESAIVPASYLKNLAPSAYDVYNVPRAGNTQYVAGHMSCIVIASDADIERTSGFISWLSDPERLQNIALKAYSVPVITVNKTGYTTFEQLLINISNISSYRIDNEVTDDKTKTKLFEKYLQYMIVELCM